MNNENQANRITVQSTKNVGVAAILAFFFGPLGLLYSTVTGGVIMFIVNVIAAIFTAGLGLIVTWPICVIWAIMAANSYNKNLTK